MAKIILRAGRVAIKIIIPFAILGLIFYSVKVLVPAQANVESFPEELAAQFEQAETYQEEGQYGEAEQIYQDIITQYPGTDGALAAQRQLTILYINWNKPAEADAALEELTSSFSEHPGIVRSVCEIADRYLDTNPAKALELYQYTMENWPSSEDAMWMQVLAGGPDGAEEQENGRDGDQAGPGDLREQGQGQGVRNRDRLPRVH